MRSSSILRAAGVSVLAVTGLSAQISLLPVGSSVGGGLDVTVANVMLPFNFTFPDGTTTNLIDINGHGRIFPGGQAINDFTQTVGELLSQPSSICAYWDDLDDFDAAADQIFFDTSVAGVATVSWVDCTESFSPNPAVTFQVQLRNDNSFAIVWDNRMTGLDGDCIVGCSVGNGAADPGASDFSDVNTMGAIVTTVNTVYEEFNFAPFNFDLADGVMTTGLDFAPTSPGYLITGMVPPPPPPPAEANPGRLACPPENFLPVPGTEVSFTLIPTAPGYLWTSGGAADPLAATGSLLATFDDSIASTTTSFPFTFPDGTSTTAVDVDSNGRLLVGGTGELSDFSPTEAEFLSDPVGQIAPLWCDYNTTDTNTVDGIRFRDDGTGTSATYYWNGVVQFANTNPNYFQVQIDATGGIQFNYLAVQINNDEATTPGLGSQNAVVGVSAGNGIVGAESDLSTGAVTSMTNVLYEFYDETLVEFDLVNNPLPPLPNATVEIVASTLPVLGTNFEVDVIDSTGTAIAAVYYFGFPTGLFIPSIPLGSVIPALAGCELLNDIVTPGAVLGGNTGTPGTPTPVISIPNLPILLGVEGLVVSGIVINPSLNPALFPTDEIVTILGV
jgi:hypothetical protein